MKTYNTLTELVIVTSARCHFARKTDDGWRACRSSRNATHRLHYTIVHGQLDRNVVTEILPSHVARWNVEFNSPKSGRWVISARANGVTQEQARAEFRRLSGLGVAALIRDGGGRVVRDNRSEFTSA